MKERYIMFWAFLLGLVMFFFSSLIITYYYFNPERMIRSDVLILGVMSYFFIRSIQSTAVYFEYILKEDLR